MMAAKRGRNAPIWDYMELSTPEQAICLVCKDTLKFSGSTTSNLFKHLRIKHPIEYAEHKEENDRAVAAKSLITPISMVTDSVHPSPPFTLLQCVSLDYNCTCIFMIAYLYHGNLHIIYIYIYIPGKHHGKDGLHLGKL